MAFAIFYELGDLSALVGTARAPSLPNTLKNRVTAYWNGGLKNWDTSPLGAAPGDTSCPLCHTLVISTGTLADFRQLLLDIAGFFGTAQAQYLITLSNDMGGSDGAREPWP